MNIPDELVKSIARGDALLFVGAGLSIGAGLPGWDALLAPLADRIGLPPALRGDPLKIAQHYQNQRGAQALISYIQEQTDTFDKQPTANHHRLLRLGIHTWVTTNFDDLLEQTLRKAGERFTKVVRDRDLPYASADRLTLIKLHGDRDQPDTIVITQQDYATYFRRFPRVKEKLSGLLVDKTFLFVGYSIGDPDFNQLQSEIAFDLQQHQRMAYAVLFDADEFTIADLRSRNIQVLNITTAGGTDPSERLGALLDELIGRVEQVRQLQAGPPRQETPSPSVGQEQPHQPQPSAADDAAPPARDTYQYDAFISCTDKDSDWVYTTLVPPLERAGLRLCLADRDFEIGVPRLINIENAVDRSRRTLLILTPNWGDSEWNEFEGLLAQTSNPKGNKQRVLPVIAQPCRLPRRLDYLTPLDLTKQARFGFDAQIQRLVAAIRATPSSSIQMSPPQQTTARAPSRGDGPIDYERGLRELKSRLQGAALDDFLVYEARLRENLKRDKLLGSTETTRSERAAVVHELNELARAHLGTDFNKLCLGQLLD